MRTHSLCTNCLKPGHRQADCRSKLSCQVCEGLHNTLIHSEQGGSTAAPSSGTVNVTSTSAANDSLHQNKLMMTCEALATGPTGKSIPVRALLDSGADISSITTRVANHLQLKHSGSQVAVATFGSPTEQVCPATHFTLSSFNKESWKLPVAAVIIKKITDDQPRQDASLVKQMPVVQGLTPADPKFHLPGRVDVLLGADVLPYIQSPSGTSNRVHQSSIIAVETVFGHAFTGTYQPTQPANTAKATVQMVAQKTEPTAEEEVNHTLTRFWEMEEPPLQQPALTKEEKMVTDHYALTHTFLSDSGKYQVALPKKQGDLKLGDSRTQAMLRYKANERAVLRKGTWKKFQEVVQEYLDLGHAMLVTNDELQLPSSEAYYLPMHGVYKESSTTTKLRVVFDASSQSSCNVSLNDTLAVGPMLHPTLDHILLRFRTYRVALSGDISKMFREIHLSPQTNSSTGSFGDLR